MIDLNQRGFKEVQSRIELIIKETSENLKRSQSINPSHRKPLDYESVMSAEIRRRFTSFEPGVPLLLYNTGVLSGWNSKARCFIVFNIKPGILVAKSDDFAVQISAPDGRPYVVSYNYLLTDIEHALNIGLGSQHKVESMVNVNQQYQTSNFDSSLKNSKYTAKSTKLGLVSTEFALENLHRVMPILQFAPKVIGYEIESGRILQSAGKYKLLVEKGAHKLGPVGNVLSAAVITNEIATNTWDAHTFVDSGMLVTGLGTTALVAAGIVAAPIGAIIVTALLIYGVADIIFDFSSKIDKNVGRKSGYWEEQYKNRAFRY